MKTCFKESFILPVLVISLGLMLAGQLAAQTFTTLHSLTGNEGAIPAAALLFSSNTLYGTAGTGGSFGWGTVFAINTNGTGFTNLHSFPAGELNSRGYPSNNDGAVPNGLVLSGNTLYGTAATGGGSAIGTVFAINTDGTGFTNLHSFTAGNTNSSGVYTNGDGAYPGAGLILSGSTLYGTAVYGGTSGNGTVFAISTNGTGFTNLHSFTLASEGANPVAELILSDKTFYGTTTLGGISDNGTLFALNTDGTGFSTLHTFSGSDGAMPSRLTLSSNTLYGTALYDGISGNGTMFAINTDGTGFTNLYSFTGNIDGATPIGRLILSGNTLFGTAFEGGTSGSGTVFAVNTDGTGFTTLHRFTAITALSFAANSDGANPNAGLVLSGNTLYGTAVNGGSSGHGTVFSIFIQPQLRIIPSAANFVLTWPTNYAGYVLQSSTNLASPAWRTNLPAPVVVNGQYTVTNPVSGTQQFFRLSN